MKKQIIIGVIIFIILILLPFAINLLIQMPAQFDIVGEPANWLMFWPTYISAAASFFMIYVTYLSLRQNREQLNEMKRQWDEEHKPEIVAYMTVHDGYFYVCVKNTSRVPIHNIRVNITHFPERGIIPSKAYCTDLLDNAIFSLEVGGCRYINTYGMTTCTPIQEDYFGLQFTYADNKVYYADLPFKEGSVILDNLGQRNLNKALNKIADNIKSIPQKKS